MRIFAVKRDEANSQKGRRMLKICGEFILRFLIQHACICIILLTNFNPLLI